MQINFTIPQDIPEPHLSNLLGFLQRYSEAFASDASQPKPLSRYVDEENLCTYPQPPQEYGGCTRAELEQIEKETE